MFFFKQKTAYEMRISDWSSDVCSSDLAVAADAERDDPRQKLGIARNIGDEREHLLVAIRQFARFVVTGQSVRPGARQLRLARGAHPFEIVAGVIARAQIGRASCRERVCQYV